MKLRRIDYKPIRPFYLFIASERIRAMVTMPNRNANPEDFSDNIWGFFRTEPETILGPLRNRYR